MPPSSMNDLFAFLSQLRTQHSSLFESMGYNMFRGFAVMLIVWFGLKSALASAGAGHGPLVLLETGEAGLGDEFELVRTEVYDRTSQLLPHLDEKPPDEDGSLIEYKQPKNLPWMVLRVIAERDSAEFCRDIKRSGSARFGCSE